MGHNYYIRSMPCLSDPLYKTPVAKRGNSKGCTVYNARLETAAKVLHSRIPLWYKVWHVETAAYWERRAKRTEWLLSRAYVRAFVRTFGRSPDPWEAYQVSGIGRDEYPESTKTRLRTLAHSVGKMRDLARVHRHVARYYSDNATPTPGANGLRKF